MEIRGEIVSKLSAQDLASVIAHMRSQPNTYFQLEMIEQRAGEAISEVALPSLMVREQGTQTMADGTEVIHCISDGGRPVDIELGRPTERVYRFARILVRR